MKQAKKPTKNPLRLVYMDPAEIAANPKNFRTHPAAQVTALKDVIGEVGWAGALLYNERTKRLIDGHARKEQFAGQKVPVLIGSWDEAAEAKILATLDPIGAMAEADVQKLDALLREVHTGSEALQAMLADLDGYGGDPLEDGWGETPENRNQLAKSVVLYLGLGCDDLDEYERLILECALPDERPIDTIRRGLNAINGKRAE